jgi:hypothetical protein
MEGIERFTGEVVHSFRYRGRDAFRGVPSDWRFLPRFSAYLPMAFSPEAVAQRLKRQDNRRFGYNGTEVA